MHTTTKVGSLIQTRALVCGPNISVSSAAGLMQIGHCSSVLLTDLEHPVGIFTEADAKQLDFDDPAEFARPVSELASMDLVRVSEDMYLHEAVDVMRERAIRHLVVVTHRGDLDGIVTLTDVVLCPEVWCHLKGHTASTALSDSLVRTHPEQSLASAAGLMREAGVDSNLVIAGNGRLVGLVTERDLVGAIAIADPGRSVGDVAHKPLLMVDGRYDLLRAWDLMTRSRLRHLVVVDEAGEALGILSFADLLRVAVADQSTDSPCAECDDFEGPITRNYRRIPKAMADSLDDYVDLDLDPA